MRGEQLAAGYYGTPWAITETKLAEIDAFVERVLAGGKLPEEELARFDAAEPELAHGREQSESGRYEIQDNVAILPLRGVISKRSTMLSRYSGGASADGFRAGLAEAIADPHVEAIVIEVDSPGGQVPGTAEASNALYEARGKKPIVAVVNELMASGATWIASAADQVILATETAQVGSIGVLTVRQDVTEAERQRGIKTHIFKAGETKDYGHPSRPVDARERRDTQARIDQLHTTFLTAVARNRGLDVDELRKRAGDAQMFLGNAAIEAGLADGIGSLESTISKLAADPGGYLGGSVTMTTQTATTTTETPAAETAAVETPAAKPTTVAELRAAFPDLVAQMEKGPETAATETTPPAAGANTGNQAADSAKLEGRQLEMKRQTDIRALCARAKMPELADKLLADPAIDATRAGELVLEKMLTANAAPADGVEPETNAGGTAAAKADPDAALRAEYQANAAKRNWQFSEDEYVASAKRDAGDGMISILPKPKESK